MFPKPKSVLVPNTYAFESEPMADDGGVDHLDSGIMGSGKCVYDAAPDAGPPPTNEAVVASSVWTKRFL
jgi:hypothetical protein